MISLHELVERLEPGHYLAWQAADAKPRDQTFPKTVQKVEEQDAVTKIDAEGQRGGKYHFTVDENGNSESYFHNPSRADPKPLGAIIFAELTDSPDIRTVKRGYYDSRSESD